MTQETWTWVLSATWPAPPWWNGNQLSTKSTQGTTTPPTLMNLTDHCDQSIPQTRSMKNFSLLSHRWNILAKGTFTYSQIIKYFCAKGNQMYNAYEKDIAVVNLYFGDSTAFSKWELIVIFMVYLTLFFIPQSSRELQKWLGWTSSPTLEGFADSALASALSRSLSSSTGSQSDSVDQLSCTEHTLNLLFIFLRSWFSQFVKVCHYCNKNTNHPITIIMIWLICFCPCQASNEKWKLRFQILHCTMCTL